MNNEQTTATASALPASYAAFVGLDWGDEEHALSLCPAKGSAFERATLKQTPEALADWANALRTRFPNGQIAVALEQARGALLAGLSQYEHIVPFPIPRAWRDSVRLFIPVAPRTIWWMGICCWRCCSNTATVCAPGSPIRCQPAN